ncbi:MAG: phosphotransferase family protein [Pseudomonadota bacterium]
MTAAGAATAGLLDPAAEARLTLWLATTLDRTELRIDGAAKLGGGAIQENWRLDVAWPGGARSLVLRTEAPSGVAVSWGKAEEYAILEVAHAAGLRVPEPIGLCDDPAVLGRPFSVMAHCSGEARGHKLVRDPAIDAFGPAVAARLAEELAKLHRIEPPVPGLDFLPLPEGNPALARVAEYRAHLAELGIANPVLALALAWLEAHAPTCPRLALIHADCRTGNYLVDDGDLVAILDWEFAAYGDPLEDLGWFLGRYWRFGRWAHEAGGLAGRDVFLDAYRRAGGFVAGDRAVSYWQLMGTVRWAVIALQQAARHYGDGEASLDLALTGAVLPQLEWDVLDLLEALDGAG